MMPPSSHSIKQGSHRMLPAASALNQLSANQSPANDFVVGSVCNGQNLSSSPHASSFAAALRKLAKKAVDPVTESDQVKSPSNSISSSPKRNTLNREIVSPPHHLPISGRPPPPPLIQSRQSLASRSSASESIYGGAPISSSQNLVIPSNSNQGLDYSINNQHRDTSRHENNFKQSFYKEQSSSFHSKDFQPVSSSLPQNRPSATATNSSSSHFPVTSSVSGFHPFSASQYQNAASQSKEANMAAYDSKTISAPYSQLHPAFFQSSIPSAAYRYNSEPMYLERYSSLLRPTIHSSGFVLPSPPPPTSSSSPSPHHYPPKHPTSIHQSPSYVPSSHYSSPEFVLSPNTSNASSVHLSHERARMEEERRKREKENELRNERSNNINHTNVAIHHPVNNDSKVLSDNRNIYDAVSPPCDTPLSLTKSSSSTFHQSKSPSHFQGSLGLINIKSSETNLSRPPSSQLPKERFKQMHMKQVMEELNEPLKNIASDLSLHRNELSKQPSNNLLIKVPSMDQLNKEPVKTSPVVRSSHYLPVRPFESHPSLAAIAIPNQKPTNGNHTSFNSHNTTSLGKTLELPKVPEVKKGTIFNPAFLDKSVPKENLKPTVVCEDSSNKNMPVIVSKLDFQLRQLKEHKKYNRFTGSDQSDEDLTDVDEDELDRYEDIRRYHLMTITSGPPMKSSKDPEKRKFLRLFGLASHRRHRNVELKKCRRQIQMIRQDMFPKYNSLMKNNPVINLPSDDCNKSVSNEPTTLHSTHRVVSPPSIHKSQFFNKLGLINKKPKTNDKVNCDDDLHELTREIGIEITNSAPEPSTSSLELSSISPASNDISDNDIPVKKRLFEDRTFDSADDENDSTPRKLLATDSSCNLSSFSLSRTEDDISIVDESEPLLLLNDAKVNKILSKSFAKDFHDSIFQKKQGQKVQKSGSIESPDQLLGSHSIASSRSANNYDTLLTPETSPQFHLNNSVLPANLLLPSQQPFKWPGIQAIMEAYERHYDLQKLEKDILSSQCQCLKLKNRELANLAEKLRSRMCDLISSKRQLDNERQQRQYAIDNLKRCIKDIR